MVFSLLLLISYFLSSVPAVTSSNIFASGLLFLSSMVMSRGWLMRGSGGAGM